MNVMRLLVLGGTHHVGRAVVEEALARGDEVTTLTRGVSGPSAPGALALHADRTDPVALRAALGDATWDAVIDTWSGAPQGHRDGLPPCHAHQVVHVAAQLEPLVGEAVPEPVRMAVADAGFQPPPPEHHPDARVSEVLAAEPVALPEPQPRRLAAEVPGP